MKNLFTTAIFLITGLLTKAQSDKWISYENPRTNMLGRQVIDGEFANILSSITSADISPDDGANYSKRKIDKQFKLSIGNILNTNSIKLKEAELKDIKVDVISQSSFGKINPNQRFVYKGVRASKIILKTELKRNTSLDLQKLIEQYQKLKTLVPDIDITKLIADTIRIKNEKYYTDTITNPNVYYLLQIAEFKTDLGTGKNNGKSLDRDPGSDNLYHNKYFYLSMHPDSLQSSVVKTEYNRLSTATKIEVETSILLKRVDNDLKLYLRYTDPVANARDKDVLIPKENFGNDQSGNPIFKSLQNSIFITRYSVGKSRYKEIYLKVDALYEQNRVRFTNYDDTNDWPFRTYIFYPESEIIFYSSLK